MRRDLTVVLGLAAGLGLSSAGRTQDLAELQTKAYTAATLKVAFRTSVVA